MRVLRRDRIRVPAASGSSPGPGVGFVGFPSSPTSGPAGWKAPARRHACRAGRGPGGWSLASASRLMRWGERESFRPSSGSPGLEVWGSGQA